MRKHKMHFIQVSASDICIAFKYLQAPGTQLRQNGVNFQAPAFSNISHYFGVSDNVHTKIW